MISPLYTNTGSAGNEDPIRCCKKNLTLLGNPSEPTNATLFRKGESAWTRSFDLGRENPKVRFSLQFRRSTRLTGLPISKKTKWIFPEKRKLWGNKKTKTRHQAKMTGRESIF